MSKKLLKRNGAETSKEAWKLKDLGEQRKSPFLNELGRSVEGVRGNKVVLHAEIGSRLCKRLHGVLYAQGRVSYCFGDVKTAEQSKYCLIAPSFRCQAQASPLAYNGKDSQNKKASGGNALFQDSINSNLQQKKKSSTRTPW